jgi:hypothetical protein
MDYFSRKSLSKYLTDKTDFNKHNINIFINDTGDIERFFKITRRLELWFILNRTKYISVSPR